MSLSLEVGVHMNPGADAARVRAEFEAINSLLRQNGLSAHSEPLGGFERWGDNVGMWKNVYLLRRAAAHLHRDGKLPEPAGVDEPECDALGDLPDTVYPQVMGFDVDCIYVPVEFSKPLLPAPSAAGVIDGRCVGSSVVLQRECADLSRSLVRRSVRPPDLDRLIDGGQSREEFVSGFEIEARVCLRLWRAASVSMASKAALVFM